MQLYMSKRTKNKFTDGRIQRAQNRIFGIHSSVIKNLCLYAVNKTNYQIFTFPFLYISSFSFLEANLKRR